MFHCIFLDCISYLIYDLEMDEQREMGLTDYMYQEKEEK